MKKHIPNFITCCNLLCGCLGIVFSFQGQLELAVYLIWLAMLFDFLDGMAARILNVKSPIGKELDSLADLITFGVLPAVLMFLMLDSRTELIWLPYLAFLIAVLSALRLAKFNVDTRQEENFIGLPTPANALFISSLVFFQQGGLPLWALIGITIVFSLLLVAELPLFSLKIKSFNWRGNELRFIFVAASALLLIFLQLSGLPVIIVLYILLSLSQHLLRGRSQKV